MARIHHTQIKQAAKLGVTLAAGDDGVVATKGNWNAHGTDAKAAIAALLKVAGISTAELMSSLADRVDAGTATDTELAEIAEEQEAAAPRRKAAKPVSPRKPKAAKAKKSKAKGKTARGAGKFRCEEEGCASRKRESDGEGGFVCTECGADASMDGDEDGASVIKRKYKNKYRPHKMTCGDALSQQIRKEFMTVRDPDTKKLKLDWTKFTAFAKANGCWSEDYKKLNKGMRRMNVVNRLRAKIADDHEVVWAV